MKKFIYDLLSKESDTSSKRFASLVILFNLIGMTWVATIADEKHITPQFMYDALTLIAGGGLGFSVIEKVFLKKEDVNLAKVKSTEPEKTDI